MAVGSVTEIRPGVLDQRGRQEFGSGDGPGGGGVEARIAKLESDVQHIAADIGEIKLDLRALRVDTRSDFDSLRAGTRSDMDSLRAGTRSDIDSLRADARSDFRLQFGALIAVAVALAGMMATGFGWLQ